ncbi:MAG: holo-ACP synthase [Chlamydiales bacterium]|nr:holo-ACP synthase [Chlamydiales bacterium]
MKNNNQTIVGIGTDIIEIERIHASIKEHGDKFLSRLFTPKEIAYCRQHKNPEKHFAGRFAAKESIAKAIGSGFGKHLSWKDIEILPNEEGQPIARLSNYHIMLSISHCNSYAVAVAIVSA